jgi:hypothetical protein
MAERLYTLRPDQGYFDTGRAHCKQVLLGTTVHEIVAHWFDMEGRFLGLERFPMAVDPPTFPGTTIYQTGSEYHRQANAELAALKQRLGFSPGDIQIRAFESEEAAIVDLCGEYEEFLESPESYAAEDRKWFEGYISEWRAKGRFALCWQGEYWLEADGQVFSRTG